MSHHPASFLAAAVQMSPVLFDRDRTTEKVLAAIAECGRKGVRLAVFPETVIPMGTLHAPCQVCTDCSG